MKLWICLTTFVLLSLVPLPEFAQNCDNWLKVNDEISGVQIGDLDVSGNQITVEALINRTDPFPDLYDGGDVVSKHDNPSDANYLLRPSLAQITTDQGFYSTNKSCDIELNKTYHIAMVYDGKTLKFYRNGYLMSQVNASGNLHQNNWITKIGTTANTASPYPADFIGYINEVRIWNVARTQNEIRQYMDQSLPNPSSQTGLLAYYTFNDLTNKQGNTQWDGTLLGNAVINQSNPTCSSYIADSCGIIIKDKIVTANFSAPDTVCLSEPVVIKNTSKNASNYLWSFCSGFSTVPATVNSLYGSLNMPVFMDYGLDDDGNYYGIVTNHIVGTITRLNFGKSLLNTPSEEDLGNFGGVVPQQVEGIQLEHVNGKWYAIAVGGGNQYPNATPRIIKLDFGNSLANTPTATNWGNIGSLDLPIDLHIEKENGNYYGFTMNVNTNSITRFDFGSDFINPPIGTDLGNIGGLSYPDGFNLVKNNNNWYSFVVNSNTNTITRLDFGSSLTNTPTPAIINNPDGMLASARDITMLNTCDGIMAYSINATNNKLIRIDFGSDITNTQPVATDLGNYSFSFPHSFSHFFTVNGDIYMFVPNVNANRIDLLKFSGCSDIQSSDKKNPNPITYSQPGTYEINLMVDIGLPTQTSYCKQVVVINCDTICDLQAGFTYQQVTCDPKIIQFQDTSVHADSIWWDFGFDKTDTVSNPVVAFPDFGKYIVHLYARTNAGCLDTATGTIDVSVKMDSAIITNDTAICAGSSIQLNAVNGLNYCWSPKGSLSDSTIQNPVASPKKTTIYYLDILTAGDQPVIRDSVIITILPLPSVNAGPDDSICLGTTTQLNASGASTYHWAYSEALSDSTIANPVASPDSTTNFVLTGYDNYGCSDTDNVIITVLDLPVIQLVNDTAMCKGGSVLLEATVPGNNSYRWLPSAGLSNTSVYNPVASPDNTTEYFVSVSDSNQCVGTDSIIVNVLPRPVVSTLNDTTVCYAQPVTLLTKALYADRFSWSPSTGLDDNTVQSPVATPLSNTTYIVAAGNGYCAERDTVTLSVLALPIVVAGNDTTVCGNATAQLSAAGAISYSWQPVTGLSDPGIANPMADPGVTTTYYVSGTDANKCTNIDSTTVIVTPVPAFKLTPQDTTVCLGNSAELAASGGDVYAWSPAESVDSPSVAATSVFPSVTTTYKVVITNTTCKVTGSLYSTVTVNDLPVVTVTKSNDIDCINWQSQLLATGGNRFKWTPDKYISNPAISDPVVTAPSDTWYYVEVTNTNGCTNKDSILVKSIFNPEASVFKVPNAFTPNHDGLNDCFGVKYWGPADVFDLSIYNRWGERVFQSGNINACWDGTYKGMPQPPGVYVYKINISSRCSNGLVQRKGTVVLIR
jgi:gliding motility-associated-like protein